MKFIFAFLFFLPTTVFAHCPFAVNIEGNSYCLDVEWVEGEQKLHGQFQEVDSLSPELVVSGTVPQKWVYSRANVKMWVKGDENHQAVQPENFRIFPFMQMENGHNHSTSYEFSYDSQNAQYVLRGMALQEMPGCWSLRWTTTGDEDLATSELILHIQNYQNVNASKNEIMAGYCSAESSNGGGGHDHHHQH